MKLQILCVALVFMLSGCSTLQSVYGVTGAKDGVRVDARTVEYKVTHPGLDVIIREDYATDLIPIETVGKSSPSPLRHVVKFGSPNELKVLEIVGKYEKDISFNGEFYGTLFSGTLLIDRGVVYLDGKRVFPVKKQ